MYDVGGGGWSSTPGFLVPGSCFAVLSWQGQTLTREHASSLARPALVLRSHTYTRRQSTTKAHPTVFALASLSAARVRVHTAPASAETTAMASTSGDFKSWRLDFDNSSQDKRTALDPPGYDPAAIREVCAGLGRGPRVWRASRSTRRGVVHWGWGLHLCVWHRSCCHARLCLNRVCACVLRAPLACAQIAPSATQKRKDSSMLQRKQAVRGDDAAAVSVWPTRVLLMPPTSWRWPLRPCGR